MAKQKTAAEAAASELEMKSALSAFVTDAEDLEKVVMAHVSDGGDERDLPSHVAGYLRNILGFDNRQVKRFVQQRASILRHREIAGSASDRSKLKKLLEAAETELAETSDRIQSEIREKQQQLRELEANVQATQRRHDDVQAACRCLRESLPQHVTDEINSKIRKLKETTGQELAHARTERRHLEMLTLDVGSQEHIDRVRIARPDLVEKSVDGRFVKYELRATFSQMVGQIPDQIAALDEQIAELENEFERGMLEIDQLKNYHLDA